MFNDKLLVGSDYLSQLFIYSREGRHLSTITINGNDKLRDAMWTPCGNIVYTTCVGKKVVVMSDSGAVITMHTQMTEPQCLSVSNDETIFLGDRKTGIFQSTDGGVNWSLVAQSADEWHCRQVVKLTGDHCDDFCALEWNDNNSCRLRTYRVDRRRLDENVTARNISVTSTNSNHVDLSCSRLSCDGNMNIFLNDYYNKTVHVLPVNGQHFSPLPSSHHIKNKPCRLAIDKESQLLYVGQVYGVVEVFKLTYGEGVN